VNSSGQVFHILGGRDKDHSGYKKISIKWMNEAMLVLIKPQILIKPLFCPWKSSEEGVRGIENITGEGNLKWAF